MTYSGTFGTGKNESKNFFVIAYRAAVQQTAQKTFPIFREKSLSKLDKCGHFLFAPCKSLILQDPNEIMLNISGQQTGHTSPFGTETWTIPEKQPKNDPFWDRA